MKTISQSGLTVSQTGNPDRWIDYEHGNLAINVSHKTGSTDIILEVESKSTRLHFNSGPVAAIRKTLEYYANGWINLNIA